MTDVFDIKHAREKALCLISLEMSRLTSVDLIDKLVLLVTDLVNLWLSNGYQPDSTQGRVTE